MHWPVYELLEAGFRVWVWVWVRVNKSMCVLAHDQSASLSASEFRNEGSRAGRLAPLDTFWSPRMRCVCQSRSWSMPRVKESEPCSTDYMSRLHNIHPMHPSQIFLWNSERASLKTTHTHHFARTHSNSTGTALPRKPTDISNRCTLTFSARKCQDKIQFRRDTLIRSPRQMLP